MLIEQLDRTQWTLAQAVQYIGVQLGAHVKANPGCLKPASPRPPWLPATYSGSAKTGYDEGMIPGLARDEVLVALRDGDLPAKGRLSTNRMSWAANDGWGLHSGHHTSISPEQWLGGRMEWHSQALGMIDGQFIDIRVPRFAVLAIWPTPQAEPAEPSSYTTAYLDLIEDAIAHWKITDDFQPKKENLVDWFRRQSVEDEPLSENLASAMATLVRLPSSQRGGAKRSSVS